LAKKITITGLLVLTRNAIAEHYGDEMSLTSSDLGSVTGTHL